MIQLAQKTLKLLTKALILNICKLFNIFNTTLVRTMCGIQIRNFKLIIFHKMITHLT